MSQQFKAVIIDNQNEKFLREIKEISLNDLNYWNVDLQEAYFSAVEADKRHQTLKK